MPEQLRPLTSRTLQPLQVLTALLIGLVAIDLLFMAAHVLYMHGKFSRNMRWSIELDQGYAERFQYFKLFAISGTLLYVFRRTREPVLLAWSALFTYLLLDDAFRFHEEMGLVIAQAVNIPPMFGMRGREVAEPLFELAVGALLLPALVLTYRSSSRRGRAISHDLLMLLLALVFFGIGVDTLHSMLTGTVYFRWAGMLEDSGEMLVISVALYYLAQWASATKYDPQAATVPFRPSVIAGSVLHVKKRSAPEQRFSPSAKS